MSIGKQKAKAEIEDVIGREGVSLEVNFDETYKDCVKITLAGEHRILKYTDLFAFMFTIASKEFQADMMPVNQELGTEYMKQIRIKCKKDMKEGEELVVNVKIHVPTVIEESLKKDVETPYLEDN